MGVQHMVLTGPRKCMGCGTLLEAMSVTGEVWHESCYQLHRRNHPGCEEHNLCKQAATRAKQRNK